MSLAERPGLSCDSNISHAESSLEEADTAEFLNRMTKRHDVNFGFVTCRLITVGLEVKKVTKIRHLGNVPQLGSFYGRSRELNELSGKPSPDPFTIILGLAGIGKSALAAQFLGQNRDRHQLWYRVSPVKGLAHFVDALIEFAKDIGTENKIGPFTDHRARLDWIIDSLSTSESLIVIDDFSAAQHDLITFCGELVRRAVSTWKLRFLVLSRARPNFYNSVDLGMGRVFELRLLGLASDDLDAWLAQKGFPSDSFAEVKQITEGHPTLVHWLTPKSLKAGKRGFLTYLRQNIIEPLDEDERLLLSFMSVFDEPLPFDALVSDAGRDPKILAKLTQKGLLIETENLYYEISHLLRGVIRGGIPRALLQQHHLEAAALFERGALPENVLSHVAHLLALNEIEAAATVLLANRSKLMQEALLPRLYKLIGDFSHHDSLPVEYALLNRMRDQIKTRWGHWKSPWETLLQTWLLLQILGHRPSLLQTRKFMGFGGWSENEIEVAAGNLKRSLELVTKSDGISAGVEIIRDLAYLYWRSGFYEQADHWFVMLQEARPGGEVDLDWGQLKIEEGNLVQARNLLQPVAWNGGEETRVRVMSMHGLALILLQEGKRDEARDQWQDALDLCRLFNFRAGRAYVGLWLAWLGDAHQSALNLIRDCQQIFTDLEDNLGAAFSSVIKAGIQLREGRGRSAVRSVWTAVENLDEHPLQTEVYTNLVLRLLFHLIEDEEITVSEAIRTRLAEAGEFSGQLKLPLATVDVTKERPFDDETEESGEEADERGLSSDFLFHWELDSQQIRLEQQFVDVGGLLEEACNAIVDLPGKPPLLLEIEPQPLPVKLDPRAFQRVLRHLLHNAAKFSHGQAVQVRCGLEENEARIEIEDKGLGIPPEELKKVFESFYQGEKATTDEFSGMGLGLSISARLCRMMKIKIELDSTLGEGTVVALIIPLVRG